MPMPFFQDRLGIGSKKILKPESSMKIRLKNLV